LSDVPFWGILLAASAILLVGGVLIWRGGARRAG
jgi:hypothetical protein